MCICVTFHAKISAPCISLTFPTKYFTCVHSWWWTFIPSLAKIRVGQKRHSPCKNAERLEKTTSISGTRGSVGHVREFGSRINRADENEGNAKVVSRATAKTVNGPRRLPPVGVDNWVCARIYIVFARAEIYQWAHYSSFALPRSDTAASIKVAEGRRCRRTHKDSFSWLCNKSLKESIVDRTMDVELWTARSPSDIVDKLFI